MKPTRLRSGVVHGWACVLAMSAGLPGSLLGQSATATQNSPDWIALCTKSISDKWIFGGASKAAGWSVATSVSMAKNDAEALVGVEGGASDDWALACAGIGLGTNLISKATFGDCELRAEFMLPVSGNSGIYLMGQYEVQLYDSHGRPQQRIGHADCGGVYGVRGPSSNAAGKPGEWQTIDISFRAPRFDSTGRKIQSARFERVTLNGRRVQDELDLPGPTGGALAGGERADGPLMLQGDHSPVAFRRIRIRPSAPSASGPASRPTAAATTQPAPRP